MHDPKFEKEVQEKMDGLQFNPSDQVWIRLEQELNKEKRRPLPLFWLFVLVGGMLIGAGGTWFFFGRNQSAGLQSSAATPTSGGVSSSTAVPSSAPLSTAPTSGAPLSTAPTSGAPSSTGTRRPTGVPFAAPSLASNSPASHAAATPPAATSQTIDV
ncbi:MAG: hypothetical protein Q8937_15000, partial [Bacteroidota bacterium]|nr:hypothetical protein [Bacteroidota bacterium]